MALNVIHLAGEVTRDTRAVSSDGAIKPGDLVEVKSDGTIKVQADAAADCVVMQAEENTAFNKSWDDSYAAGDQARVIYPMQGAKVYANLANGGSAVVAGDGLESAGSGKVRKLASGVRLFNAEEAADPSAAEVRVKATKK